MTIGNWRNHAVFIGNTKAAVIPERLRGLKTLRVGTQAVDINGEALDPKEYLPLYIDKSEEKAYDDIMRNALRTIRRG